MTSRCTIKIPTYNCEVLFIVTSDVQKEAVKIYKKHNALESVFTGGAEGAVFSFDIDKYYYLIAEKYITHNTIAHELHHIVMTVSKDRGIYDEEAQCWTSGHIAQEIYKFLEKKKYKVKHD